MRKNLGFSLVELSIVLVILGLLTGGILAGQSLVRSAQMRAVTTEHSRYMSATQAFRDKYFAYPGDMNNAQSFWGVAHATPATCVTTASTDTKTCNGDFDGKVRSAAAGSNESFRFWQHLSNAGLIEGTYDGVAHGAYNYSSTAANVPGSKISNAYWNIRDWGETDTDTNNIYSTSLNNTFQIGGLVNDRTPRGLIFTPSEVWNIDTKMDDGKPARGKVIARGVPTCTTSVDNFDLNGDYKLTDSGYQCAIMFPNAF